MLAVICSFIVCIDRDRARQLVLVIAWSGVAYAVYGIAAYLIDPTHILWRDAPTPGNRVLTSTFNYRSTAAVYFGLCAVVWLLFVLQHFRRACHWIRFIGGAPRICSCLKCRFSHS